MVQVAMNKMDKFDEHARQRLAALLAHPSFDRSLVDLELVDAGGGRARARLPVSLGVQNLGGSLHGGAVATLVDVVGTVAIMSADAQGRPGVTTDLNVSYFAAGKGVVVAEAVVLKAGRTLAFVAVDVKREDDGVLIAQGRMTKHLGS
jgi:acyl-coenzyme A thioesterase 13